MNNLLDIQAVLTCDLINASQMEVEERRDLIQRLKWVIDHLMKKNDVEYTLFRGDSIQGLIQYPEMALHHALFIKSYIKSYKPATNKRASEADIRVSIGLGTIDFMGEGPLDSDGPAFRYSGRTLDEMKKLGRTIMMTSEDIHTNETWDVILSLLEEVMGQWTIASAETLWKLLDGMDDKMIQQTLGISQSAVSQRKKYAGWEAIQKTLKLYHQTFKSITDGHFS